MDKKSYPFIVLAIALVAVISFISFNKSEFQGGYQKFKSEHIEYVKIATVKIKVSLALSREEQEQGLSGRSGLPEDEGMLFVFDQPGKYYFWMKDMNFAIDMIWIGEDGRVIYIKKNALPEKFLETYGPNQNAKYVLEVISGFSDKNNLKEGDKVEFF